MLIPSIAFFLLLAVILAAMAVGGMLLKRGWWPKRVGEEPQCRACGYSLIGIASQRCPECGAMLWPETIVIGRRERRKGLAGLGAFILLIGLTMAGAVLFQTLDGIQWYQYKPTFLVMRDLRGGSLQAMTELDRRETTGALSSKYEQQIVEMALVQQATTATTGMTPKLIDFLQTQYTAGHLSEAQKTRFGQQCVVLSLRLRPIVMAGDRVPYQIGYKTRVCSGFLVKFIYGVDQIEVDGKKLRYGESSGSGGGSMNGLGSGGAFSGTIEHQPVGKHHIVITSHVELQPGTLLTSKVVFQEDRKLEGGFEVIATQLADYFKLVDDPKLGDQIKAAIVPSQFSLEEPMHTYLYLRGQLKMRAMPVNIAFDVIARLNNHEYNLGRIIANKGASSNYSIGGTMAGNIASTQPAAFDLILRSSETAARETVDQHEIWKGELIYRDVPVGKK